jgi:hypothetical protein
MEEIMREEKRTGVTAKAMFKNMETEKNEEFMVKFDLVVQVPETIEEACSLLGELQGDSCENFLTWFNLNLVKKFEDVAGRILIDKERGGDEKPLPSNINETFENYAFTRSSAKSELAKAQAELAGLNPTEFVTPEGAPDMGAFMEAFKALQEKIGTLTAKAEEHGKKLAEARAKAKAKAKDEKK